MNLGEKGPPLAPPDYNHSCEDSGTPSPQSTPVHPPFGSREPDVPCVDYGDEVEQSVLHRLLCGHHLCGPCLGNRTTCRISREQARTEAYQAANQLYKPDWWAYAKDHREKCRVTVALWRRMGWTCCDEIISFSDYMHRDGCMLEEKAQDAGSLWQWERVIDDVESVGNGIIMYFLEGYMELDVRGEGEVFICRYPGMVITIMRPFQNFHDDPERIMRTVPKLARTWRVWRVRRFLGGLPVAPSLVLGAECSVAHGVDAGFRVVCLNIRSCM